MDEDGDHAVAAAPSPPSYGGSDDAPQSDGANSNGSPGAGDGGSSPQQPGTSCGNGGGAPAEDDQAHGDNEWDSESLSGEEETWEAVAGTAAQGEAVAAKEAACGWDEEAASSAEAAGWSTTFAAEGASGLGEDGGSGGSRPADPLRDASALSQLLFLWASPLLKLGASRSLEEIDLPDLSRADSSAHNRSVVEGLWDREVEARDDPSLFFALGRHYIRSMVFAQMLLVASMAARVGQALALGLLLEQFETAQADGKQGYLWTGALVLCGSVLFLSKQRQFFETYRGGMRLRIGLVGAIFAKALRLSSIGGVYAHTSGQVTNLASNDVERFCTASVNAIYLIWGPVEAAAILVAGIRVIGFSFAAGYVLLLIFVPLQFYLSKRFAFLRSKVAAITDSRVSTVSQAVAGSRIMKMNAWEERFADKIFAVRKKEVHQILKASRSKALNESIYFFSNVLVSVVIFSVHVMTGGTLTSRNVFTTMTLLNILQYTIAKHIPYALMGVAECYVSSKRIQSFLETPDLPRVHHEVQSQQKEECCDFPTSKEVISLLKATCHWDGFSKTVQAEKTGRKTFATDSALEGVNAPAASDSNTMAVALCNITLHFRTEQLYFIIGKVGSGKSALLEVLAGELPLSSGKMHRNFSSFAFASQAPWIMNGSVRENITMGISYREDWYAKVVDSCGLSVDFSQLRHGDRTLVGDRGVQLSGGQRARVGLARALYRDPEVLLLDDPLSAVDTKVGRLIFYTAIRKLGVNRGKCVVLATHQHQYIGNSLNCILIDNGSVVCQGSFSECVISSKGALDSSLQAEDEDSTSVSSQAFNQNQRKENPANVHDNGSSSGEESKACTDGAHEEDRNKGIVKLDTWVAYANAMGGVRVGFGLLAIFAVTQASSLVNIVVMGKWAERSPQDQDSLPWLGVIIGLAIGTVFLSIVRARLSFLLCIKASQRLHDHMTRSVLLAKVEFFDVNPVGRILNRFSADVGIIDELLPLTIYDFLVGGFMAIGGVATAIVVLPLILLALPPLVWCFLRLRRIFVTTTRELKRLEGLGRSPIYAMLSEALSGIATIRANSSVEYFRQKFEAVQDAHTRAFFAFVASSRWFATRVDIIAFTLMSLASLLAVLFHEKGWFDVDPAVLGLALTMLLQLAGTNFPWITRQSAEVVNQMVSVERITSFSRLPSEAALMKVEPDSSLRSAGWPLEGSIDVQGLSVRYRSSLPLSLQNVSFRIQPGHRVGVCGRTGSGKSTLVQSLFRILEAEDGYIAIDGTDISTIGLHTLRSKMSIIPQNPTLYSGCTIRENLDPFYKHSDENIRGALRDVQIDHVIQELPKGWDSTVSEDGSNFSVGQRQLLCLARAILCKNKILILDEATANVDRRTDQQLQEALQKNFRGATVVSVAHRLETVIDYDYILVLGNGKLLEYGSPAELLHRNHGFLASMVEDTGEAMSRALRQRAGFQG